VVHQTVSGGAPDSVRCARPASGEQATLGINRRRTTIIHRTLRWCTGLSGEPTVASATVGHAIRGRRVARANGRQGAPDCPVCTEQCPVRQLPWSCNGRLRQKRKEIGTGPSTVIVRCATRQKARMTFLVGLQRLLAALGLKGTPRRMEELPKLTRNILRLQDFNFTHSILCDSDLSTI
jgi:hypothetical protein